MTTAQKCRIITRTFSDLRDISNDKELKAAGLTLAEYHAAIDIFNDVSRPNTKTETFMEKVAEYYKKHGYTVKAGTINYTISI